MNFSTKNKGVFFPYDESKPDDGGIYVREIPVGELDKIQKTTRIVKTEFKVNPTTKIMQRFEYYKIDSDAEAEKIWDYTLVSFEKTVVDGKELTPSFESKLILLQEVPGFFTFFKEKMAIVRDENRKLYGRGDGTKNSKTSQSTS